VGRWMRPAGEIRAAVLQTLREQGAMPLVDLVQRLPLQTSQRAVQHTVENALRAGLLAKVGHEKRPHCTKWVALYDLAEPGDDMPVHDGGLMVLGAALSAWR
jgi:hypothetical protein